MSQKYEKLKTLLKELFQLDQPDLDFGLYRVMHTKAAEVSQFLDTDLLPQVKAAFAQYKTADKAELENELSKVIAGIETAEMDPADSPTVKDLRTRIESDAVDIGALETEVYDHLFGFFRRYYSEGDFLAKRVYKPGVYAIPYEGEEVTLHWANKDHYYIKTSEHLRDYAFRLRPDDETKPLRVHFRLTGRRRGRAWQRQGRRGQGPLVHLGGVGWPWLHRRGGRRAGQGARYPLRVPPGDAHRLARGRTCREKEAPGTEGPEHARFQTDPGRDRRRMGGVDRRTGQAAHHGERRAGRLQPAGGASQALHRSQHF